MAGNVMEWVADWYADDYYNRAPDRNPQGPDTGDRLLLRGGSFDGYPWCVRCASRHWHSPYNGLRYYGFRLVMAPDDL
jgi:formylglycine-generating enzyme required for sulfatase activity